MLNYPNLVQHLYPQLHNSMLRLHDDGKQLNIVKKIATSIMRLDKSDRPVNVSIETFQSKWLSFNEKSISGRKTRIFRVYNTAPGELLGQIKWMGQLCCYCFFPGPGCYFSTTDLCDIQEFIALLMDEWKNAKVAVKTDVLK